MQPAAAGLGRGDEFVPGGQGGEFTLLDALADADEFLVDDTARPWRWRPSNSAGAGTLARLTLQGRANFESDHGDVEAYDGVGDYRMYVAGPSRNQVMRYQQTLDGSAFSEPSPYLASQTAEVADFEQIYIDFDVYALFRINCGCQQASRKKRAENRKKSI